MAVVRESVVSLAEFCLIEASNDILLRLFPELRVAGLPVGPIDAVVLLLDVGIEFDFTQSIRFFQQ